MSPYRIDAQPPPRRLVLRPKRAVRSVVFFFVGAPLATLMFYGASEGIAPAAIFALVPTTFVIKGLIELFARIELVAHGGVVVATSYDWPRPPLSRRVALDLVDDVVIETTEAGRRLAIVARGERVPITDSQIAHEAELEPRARQVRSFLLAGHL
ncbi:MAG: hypothetical protein KF819_03620 [Labilithrix sp.]|nr:hypothetical protein [Labilithrix sp.]